MNRHLKQFIYGGFYLAIILFLISAGYFIFLKPAPSCFDNSKNQNEEGIDCGGVCSQACIPSDISEIEISSAKIFRLDNNHASLFAEIKNPNAALAAKNFHYVFNVYDNQGQLSNNFSGDSFLYGGETGYLLFPNFQLSPSASNRLEVVLENVIWVKSDDFKKPEIDLGSIVFSPDGNLVKISGFLSNQSIKKFDKIEIIAVLNEAPGKSIGASKTELLDVAPGSNQPFSISHPFLPNIKTDATAFFIRAIE